MMSAMAGVRLLLRGVSKRFGTALEPHVAIDCIDLEVLEGEFLSVYGP